MPLQQLVQSFLQERSWVTSMPSVPQEKNTAAHLELLLNSPGMDTAAAQWKCAEGCSRHHPQGLHPWQGTTSSNADHCVHQWVETKVRFVRPHNRLKLSAEGWQGRAAHIFIHYIVNCLVRQCGSVWNSSVKKVFAFFSHFSRYMVEWLRESKERGNSWNSLSIDQLSINTD